MPTPVQFLAQPLNNQTITGAGTTTSAAFNMNPGYNNVEVSLEITAAPTGTTPTLIVGLLGSFDGVNYFSIGTALTSQNAVGITSAQFANVDAPLLKLQYVEAGTTPSFTGLYANVYAY